MALDGGVLFSGNEHILGKDAEGLLRSGTVGVFIVRTGQPREGV